METWTIPQGSALSRTLTFNDEHGSAVKGYTTSNILGGYVWAGEDQIPLITFSPTTPTPPATASTILWHTDGTDAKADLTIPGGVGGYTTGLDIGVYRVVVTVDTNAAFEASLKITWAPGKDVKERVYCSYEEVMQVARWVEQVQDPDEDQAGFLRQRVQAREEIDDAIVAAYRGTSIGQFGLASLSAIGWAGGGPRRSNMTSYLIRQYLNGRGPMIPPGQTNPEGFLMRRCTLNDLGIFKGTTPYYSNLSSTDDKLDFLAKADRPMTNRVAAYRTAALIGLAQVGVNNTHATYGAVCNSQFEKQMMSYTAELDINLDGLAEISIKCGSTNTLFT